MITVEEITGYFDLNNELQIYVNGNRYLPMYPCRQCFGLILGRHLKQHIEWHLSIKIPDKDKSPDEIRAEAKRELGAMKHELPLT